MGAVRKVANILAILFYIWVLWVGIFKFLLELNTENWKYNIVLPSIIVILAIWGILNRGIKLYVER